MCREDRNRNMVEVQRSPSPPHERARERRPSNKETPPILKFRLNLHARRTLAAHSKNILWKGFRA
jgi:hypothetical protein